MVSDARQYRIAQAGADTLLRAIRELTWLVMNSYISGAAYRERRNVGIQHPRTHTSAARRRRAGEKRGPARPCDLSSSEGQRAFPRASSASRPKGSALPLRSFTTPADTGSSGSAGVTSRRQKLRWTRRPHPVMKVKVSLVALEEPAPYYLISSVISDTSAVSAGCLQVAEGRAGRRSHGMMLPEYQTGSR